MPGQGSTHWVLTPSELRLKPPVFLLAHAGPAITPMDEMTIATPASAFLMLVAYIAVLHSPCWMSPASIGMNGVCGSDPARRIAGSRVLRTGSAGFPYRLARVGSGPSALSLEAAGALGPPLGSREHRDRQRNHHHREDGEDHQVVGLVAGGRAADDGVAHAAQQVRSGRQV